MPDDSSQFPISHSVQIPKVKRKRGNTLERWEVALVKAMLVRGVYSDQDIQAYFTRPMRTVNHRAFGEIRRGSKHKSVKATSDDTLAIFLAAWPDVDQDTGLSCRGDELLIKAREAMIAAVHTFNGAGLTFRAELFIVTRVWTQLAQHLIANIWIIERKFRAFFSNLVASLRISFILQKKRSTTFRCL